MKQISVGRYIPVESMLHRLDPRVKIVSLIALIVAIFMPFDRFLENGGETVQVTYWALSGAMYGVMLLIGLSFFLIGRLNILKLFSSMKSLWFTVVLLMVLYVVLPNYAVPTLGIAFHVEAMNWTVYWDSFVSAARIFLRIVLVMMFTFVLTATTKPLDLTYAFEWYLSPLKLVRFPAAEIAMTISIALRFIPTLLDDVDRISKAQASRGASYNSGGIKRKVVGLTALIVPLFVSSFLRSEELAYAMICRGYDPKLKRTRYHRYRFHIRDLLFFLFSAAVLAAFIYLCVTHLDILKMVFGREFV